MIQRGLIGIKRVFLDENIFQSIFKRIIFSLFFRLVYEIHEIWRVIIWLFRPYYNIPGYRDKHVVISGTNTSHLRVRLDINSVGRGSTRFVLVLDFKLTLIWSDWLIHTREIQSSTLAFQVAFSNQFFILQKSALEHLVKIWRFTQALKSSRSAARRDRQSFLSPAAQVLISVPTSTK